MIDHSFLLAVNVWLGGCMIAIALFDMKELRIPDPLILFMLPAAAVFPGNPPERILSAAAVWAGFALIAAVSALFGARIPIGMGDIKLFSAIALIAGPRTLLRTLCLSSLLAGAFSAATVIAGALTKNKKDRIAFGPFISIAFICLLVRMQAG